MMRWIVALCLLVAACSSGTAETTTTAAAPATSAAPVSTTSTTQATTTTSTTVPEVVVLEPIPTLQNPNGDISRKLSEGLTYEGGFDGVTVLVTPPTGGWELSSYAESGADAGLQFDWGGPSGFRDETWNVRVFDVRFGVDQAWERMPSAVAA